MSVSITVTGADAVAARFNQMAAWLEGPGLAGAVEQGGQLIINDAQRFAPRRTGALANSIRVMREDISGSAVTIVIGSDLIYARIQEYGGTITATRAPYLVFQTADGQWHKVKSVTLPAHPYLRPALDANRTTVPAMIRAALSAGMGGA